MFIPNRFESASTIKSSATSSFAPSTTSPLEIDLSDNRIVESFNVTAGALITHKCKTQQYLNGVPLFGASLVAKDCDLDTMQPVLGKWYNKHSINITTIPTLSSSEALTIALDEI